jgi:hypothetical protein
MARPMRTATYQTTFHLTFPWIVGIILVDKDISQQAPPLSFQPSSFLATQGDPMKYPSRNNQTPIKEQESLRRRVHEAERRRDDRKENETG